MTIFTEGYTISQEQLDYTHLCYGHQQCQKLHETLYGILQHLQHSTLGQQSYRDSILWCWGVHINYLLEVETKNAAHYVQIKKAVICTLGRVPSEKDCHPLTQPHTAHLTSETNTKNKWEVLPHSYGLDLAPYSRSWKIIRCQHC